MKRWVFRLLMLSATVGLGWGAVTMAQRDWGTSSTPPPDFSKPPVNAAAMAEPSSRSATPVTPSGAGDRYASGPAAADPFQNNRYARDSGVQQASGELPAEPAAMEEPQRFSPDPDATPVAGEPRRNDLREGGIPSARDVGLTTAESPSDATGPQATQAGGPGAAAETTPSAKESAMNDDGPRPADPFGLRRGPSTQTAGPVEKSTAAQQSAVGAGDRYATQPNDTTTKSVVAGATGAGLAAATGAIGSLRNESQTPASAASASSGDRYRSTAPTSDDDMESRLVPSAGKSLVSTPSQGSSPFPQRGAANSMPGLANSTSEPPFARSVPSEMPLTNSTTNAPINIEGNGKPGDQKLEGAQSPTVTIEKLAPPEIQVGKAAKFQIVVRNTGAVSAEGVEVNDAVPQGTQLVSTTPKASTGPRGEVQWKLGDMKPGDEVRLEMEVMPVAEGEIGSVATVQFRSAASARTIATKPELVLEIESPKEVMIGTDVTMAIKLSNPGTGAASGVKLTEKVPQGFQHPAGGELEMDVGSLKPGETRSLQLTLRGVQAGKFANKLVVEGDASLHTEQTATIEVIAPALEIAVSGPGLRYLERQAKYTVSVTNPGTAPAKDIELVTHLPKGMQFVEASDSGFYDAKTHSVMWGLAELPAGQTGSVTLATTATETGDQKVRGEVKASGGLSDTSEQVTVVDGVAAVLFTVVDVDDPVEVGGNATYEIHVVNQGSKAASRVAIGALLPAEMKPVSADGPARYSIEGQQVIFEPLARLAPKADVTYKVTAQALAPGDLRIKAQLMTDEMQQPITQEEGTKVYKDQ